MNDDDEKNPTRRSLVGRLKNLDDQESWKQFFDMYWKLIYSSAIRAGLSEAEAHVRSSDARYGRLRVGKRRFKICKILKICERII